MPRPRLTPAELRERLRDFKGKFYHQQRRAERLEKQVTELRTETRQLREQVESPGKALRSALAEVRRLTREKGALTEQLRQLRELLRGQPDTNKRADPPPTKQKRKGARPVVFQLPGEPRAELLWEALRVACWLLGPWVGRTPDGTPPTPELAERARAVIMQTTGDPVLLQRVRNVYGTDPLPGAALFARFCCGTLRRR